MAIFWITSMHLSRIFECKYNTEIIIPFFSDELLPYFLDAHFLKKKIKKLLTVPDIAGPCKMPAIMGGYQK